MTPSIAGGGGVAVAAATNGNNKVVQSNSKSTETEVDPPKKRKRSTSTMAPSIDGGAIAVAAATQGSKAVQVTNNKNKETLFCDVCWAKPKKQGMRFFQCKTCKVGVHDECYGIVIGRASEGGASSDLPNDKSDIEFECWACQAVNTTTRVRARDPTTKQRLVYKTLERPTECCLCSVNDKKSWYHAMHPVYDHHGSSGRQLVLPPVQERNGKTKGSRLAWAHTLCCLAINSHSRTAGCVFGCDAQGSYVGENADDYSSDASSVNSDLDADVATTIATTATSTKSIHHFVYCLTNKPGEQRRRRFVGNAWTKRIAEQQQLKCHICGMDDTHPSSYRISIQCSANDTTEFKAFRKHHTSLRADEDCYVNMHVGCSIWGRNSAGQLPTCRRVYYFPGIDGSKQPDTVTNVFCEAHAQDLAKGGVGGANIMRYPKHVLTRHDKIDMGKNDALAAAPALETERDRVARAVEQRSLARFGQAKRGSSAVHGDARDRLGLRKPSDKERLSATAVAVAPHRKRKSSTSTKIHVPSNHDAVPVNKRQSRTLSNEEVDQLRSNEQMNQPRALSNEEMDQLRRKMRSNIKTSLARIERHTLETVRKIRFQWHHHYRRQTVGTNKMTAFDFERMWTQVWDSASQGVVLHHGVVQKKQELAKSVTSNKKHLPRAKNPSSPSLPQKKPSAAKKTDSAAAPAAAPAPAAALQPPQDTAADTKSAKSLLRAVVKEIRDKLNEGSDHLDDILKVAEAKWRTQVVASDFGLLWDTVLRKIAAKHPGYSMDATDWKQATNNGASNNTGAVLDLKKWDTIEVVRIGHPPPL